MTPATRTLQPPAWRHTAAVALLLVACALPACGRREPAAAEAAQAPRELAEAAAPELARLGDGLLVWESRRSGAWRIWTRRLDGSGLRQLTADEPGRQHCCPHLSPDGRQVAYLSLGDTEYAAEDEPGRLHLVSTEGGETRLLAASAGTYGRGHRAAVWHGPQALQYVGGDGGAVRLDLATGATRRLAGPDAEGRGWLFDPTLGHATTGVPTFSPYAGESAAVSARRPLGGCEPYLTDDGRWGFWIAGAGGPLRRIDLATRATADLVEKNDARLGEQAYVYFPMVSNGRQLLAFGASTGEHDHERADYEVFVAAVDPATLELRGPPLRYTSHPGSDRYPDVWAAPLPLGRHAGEAPMTVEIATPDSSPGWRFDFGDGTPAAAGRAHEYVAPGVYTVTASRDGQVRRGLVVVATPQPPRVLGVALRGGDELVVVFDEPVDAARLEARLASGLAVARSLPSADGRSLHLRLAAELEGADRLHLAGIRDRARHPNAMPPTELEIAAPRWPSDRRGLAFLWETAAEANLVRDPLRGAEVAAALQPRGRARLDHHHRLALDGGAFTAEPELAAGVVELLRAANQMTLELTLEPDSRVEDGVLAALAPERGRPQLVLEQRGRRLGLRLRLGPKVEAADLGPAPESGPLHLVVGYSPGLLVAYFDGREALRSEDLQDDFFGWKAAALVFGSHPDGSRPWRGHLDGIAIYDRLLTAQEAAENHHRWVSARAARPAVAQARARATLLRRSRTPTLQEIAPYRQALAVHEFRVEEVLAGELTRRVVRVARWVILDGETQPASRLGEGDTAVLRLEPFADNPQLESVFLADELAGDPPAPLYYDAGS